MAMGIPAPAGEVVQRELHFFWLADCSGSMSGKKIAKLNQAIREAIPEVQRVVAQRAKVKMMMRAIKFSDNADWHVGPAPVDIDQFIWPELDAGGVTSTADAIRLLSSALANDKMPNKGYPPVCILISDGHCSDPTADYERAIAELQALSWGKRAVRLVIAVAGDGSDYDAGELLKFVSHKEVGVLEAHTAPELVKYIKWATVQASVGATQGKGGAVGDGQFVQLSKPDDDIPVLASQLDVF